MCAGTHTQMCHYGLCSWPRAVQSLSRHGTVAVCTLPFFNLVRPGVPGKEKTKPSMLEAPSLWSLMASGSHSALESG